MIHSDYESNLYFDVKNVEFCQKGRKVQHLGLKMPNLDYYNINRQKIDFWE